jgi:teichuronic acid exporter
VSPHVARAAAWSAGDLALRQGVQLLVVVVLAHLLTPTDFGAVALLTLFTGLAAVLIDGGLSTALIQRDHIDRLDESTVFWANVALGGVLGFLLGILGPVLADFYNVPVLASLGWVMGASLFLSSLAATPIALLTRRLEFRTILIAGLWGGLASGAVAIAMALLDYGVWALAGQIAVNSAVTTLVIWRRGGWRPLAKFSHASAQALLGFGGFVLMANVIDVAYSRAYTLIAGRMFGLREVGYYNRADTAQQIPADALSTVVARVALPVFSRNARDPDQLRAGVQRAIRILMFINVPLMLGLAALSGPFVAVVFGAQWLAVPPILQILCLGGLLWPLHVVNVQVLLAQGHARLLLSLELVKKSVGIGLLAAGALLFGLHGLAWAQVVFGAFALVVNAIYTRRFLGFGLRSQLIECAAPAVIAAPIAVGVLYLERIWAAPALLELAVLAVCAGAIYLAVSAACHLRGLSELTRAFPVGRSVRRVLP